MNSLSKLILSGLAGRDFEFDLRIKSGGGFTASYLSLIKSLDWDTGILTYHDLAYDKLRDVNVDDVANVIDDEDESFLPGAAHHTGDVDHWRGTCPSTVELATLVGNEGRGPNFNLAISHCSAGEGAVGNWSPCVSYGAMSSSYTPGLGICRFFTSEGQFLNLVTDNFADFNATVSKAGITIGPANESYGRFKLLRNDGSVELLGTTPPSTNHVWPSPLYLPKKIVSPQGHSLYLKWFSNVPKPTWDNEHPRPRTYLESISDDSRILVRTAYSDDFVLKELEIYPGTPQSRKHNFIVKDKKLQEIRSESKDLITRKTFTYGTSGGEEHVKEMTDAVVVVKDKTETIINTSTTTMTYEDGRVRTRTVKPGAQGVAQTTGYTYETIASGQVTTVTRGSEVVRHYFGLKGELTRTTIKNGACSTDIAYTMSDDPKTGRRSFTTTTTLAAGNERTVEAAMYEVDTYGNLVRQSIGDVTTEWTYYRGEPKIEHVVTGTEQVSEVSGQAGVIGLIADYGSLAGLLNRGFGKFGVTWGTVEHRAVIRSPWATKDGKKRFNLPVDIECAGNPNYATVHVESEKVYRTVEGKRVDIRWTFYGYSGFAVSGSSVRGPWMMPSVKLTIHSPRSSDGVKLDGWSNSAMELERTAYHTDTGSVAYGRTREVTRVLLDDKGMEIPLSLNRATFAYTLNADELVTDVTIESPVNVVPPASGSISTASVATTKQTLSQSVSVLSGGKLRAVDMYGGTTEYVRDSLGRLIRQIDNAQDETQREVSTFEYAITVGGWQTTASLPSGAQNRETVDFAGNVTSTEYRGDPSGSWLVMSSASYDEQGRTSTVKEFDYRLDRDAESKKLVATKLCEVIGSITYDGWGRACKVETAGGVTRNVVYDPIAHKLTQWDSKGAYIGPRDIKLWDASGRLTRAEVSDGAAAIGTSFKFDAFGGLSEAIPDVGEARRYSYDSLGRLVSSQPAVAGVSGTYLFGYPAHLSSDIVSRVAALAAVGDKKEERVLGSRSLDGLERTIDCTIGGRTQSFSYVDAGWIGVGNVSLKTAKDIERSKVEVDYDPLIGEMVETAARLSSLGVFSAGDLSLATKISLRGRLLRDDAGGVGATIHTYDSLGRLSSSKSGEVERSLSYDDGGRVSSETIRHVASKQTMSVAFQYDSFNRETGRTFTLSGFPVLNLRRSFDKAGRLGSAETFQDGEMVRSEKFFYDASGRLSGYECIGKEKPVDARGKVLDKQLFTYDAIGNIAQVTSEFAGGKNVATFTYDATDFTQLRNVTHSSAAYPTVSLKYDDLGRLSEDNTHKYFYDSWGRLSETQPRDGSFGKYYDYFYDDAGRLVGRKNNADVTERFHYSGNALRSVYALFPKDGAYWYREVRLMNQSDTCVCQATSSRKIDAKTAVTNASFEVLDAHGSLVARYDLGAKTLSHFSYTPYGDRPVDGDFANWLGFAGETPDHFFGRYHLGGYRVYDPALGRFQEPDGMSPFDEGGPNGYAYCSGDPINFIDPSGHAEVIARYSVMTHKPLVYDPVVQAALVGGLGIALAPFTGGGSLYLTAAAVGLATVSAGFGIAAAALQESDPALAEGFGWASLATGMASAGAGLLAGASRAGASVLRGEMGRTSIVYRGSSRLGTLAGNVSVSASATASARAATSTSRTASRVAYGSGPVRMGGTMRALEQIQGDLYTFVDDYKNGVANRLNIAVHGSGLSILERVGNSGNVVLLTVNGNTAAVSARELLTLLQKKGVYPATYEHVRLLICYGGSGGSNSFAAQFQRLIGKPVKAYKNAIWMTHGSTGMEAQFASKVSHVSYMDLVKDFATSKTHFVAKTNPFSLLKEPAEYASYLANPYMPVYFP